MRIDDEETNPEKLIPFLNDSEPQHRGWVWFMKQLLLLNGPVRKTSPRGVSQSATNDWQQPKQN